MAKVTAPKTNVSSYVILRKQNVKTAPPQWEVVSVAPRGLRYGYVRWASDGMGPVVITSISYLHIFGLSPKEVMKPYQLPRVACEELKQDYYSLAIDTSFYLKLLLLHEGFQQVAADWLRYKITGNNDSPKWWGHYIINEPYGAQISAFLFMKEPKTEEAQNYCDILCQIELASLAKLWRRVNRKRIH